MARKDKQNCLPTRVQILGGRTDGVNHYNIIQLCNNTLLGWFPFSPSAGELFPLVNGFHAIIWVVPETPRDID